MTPSRVEGPMTPFSATSHHLANARPDASADDAPRPTAGCAACPPAGQHDVPPAADPVVNSSTIGYRLTGRSHTAVSPPIPPPPHVRAPAYTVVIVERPGTRSTSPRLPFTIAIISATPAVESPGDKGLRPPQRHAQQYARPPNGFGILVQQSAPTAAHPRRSR